MLQCKNANRLRFLILQEIQVSLYDGEVRFLYR